MDLLVVFILCNVVFWLLVLISWSYIRGKGHSARSWISHTMSCSCMYIPSSWRSNMANLFHYVFFTRNCIFQVLYLLLVVTAHVIIINDGLLVMRHVEPDTYHLLPPLIIVFINLFLFLVCSYGDPGRLGVHNVAQHIERLTVMCAYGASAVVGILTALTKVLGLRTTTRYLDPATGKPLQVTDYVLVQILTARFPRLMFMEAGLLVLSIIVGGFLSYHLFLTLTNQTTNERHKINNLRRNHKKDVANTLYNRGIVHNLIEEFCPRTLDSSFGVVRLKED